MSPEDSPLRHGALPAERAGQEASGDDQSFGPTTGRAGGLWTASGAYGIGGGGTPKPDLRTDRNVHHAKPGGCPRCPCGYSALARSFVRNIHRDSEASEIVHLIVLLAPALGFETCAEGVESLGERDFLKELGVRSFQGFLASPALCLRFTSLLEERRSWKPASLPHLPPDRGRPEGTSELQWPGWPHL